MAGKCRICGQGALPALGVCAQCKAALKRARQDTVSQLFPVRRAGAGKRGRAPDHDTPGGTHAPATRVSIRRIRVPLAIGAAVAVVASAGHFLFWQIHAATPDTTLPLRPFVPLTAVTSVSAPSPSADSAAASDATDASSAEHSRAAAALQAAAAAKARSAARSKSLLPPVAIESRQGPQIPVMREVIAAAPQSVVAPQADHMVLLSRAIAQCPGDSLLARAICEQKARLQYCDGYWGQNESCPNGTIPYFSR